MKLASLIVALLGPFYTYPFQPAFAEPPLAGTPWPRHTIDDTSRGADGVKLGDLNRDGRPDIATGWEEGGLTRVYLHPGPTKTKRPWPAVTVGRTPAVEDAVFADLDSDGRLDVVSCSEATTRKLFVHWAPTDASDLLRADRWQQQTIDDRQMWMFAWPMQVDGRHGVDLIAGSKGDAPGGNGAQIGWFEAPAHGRNVDDYRWHPISDAGWIMSIWKQDMDDDGDQDIVISDRYGRLRGCRWLENPGVGSEQLKPWLNHFMGGRNLEVLSMTLADLDGDGRQDAITATRENKLLLFKRLDGSGRNWKTTILPGRRDTGFTRAVAVADVDGDNHTDIIYTTANAAGKHGVVWLRRTAGTNGFDASHWTAHTISGDKLGIKYDRIEMLDLDGDGDLDVLTCEEHEGGDGLGVFWYENPFGS